MESLLSDLSKHGYAILFAAVFLEAIGIPIPAALALLFGGAASAQGILTPWAAAGGALSTMLLADTLMFLLGRYTGWWLLGLLCRVSLNPESCIVRSADSFHRRGRIALLFAKFVPGINTMAPPLAGSMNMRYPQFLRLDFVGAFLYVGTYFTVGFLFSGALDRITAGYHAAAHVLGWVLLGLAAAYAGVQAWGWNKSRTLPSAPSVSPEEAARVLASGGAVIFDVRSHGYYDRRAVRVKGSKRLDPNAFPSWVEELPQDRLVYLYCTCLREATSARVVKLLRERGIQSAVITGGLSAWKKAGLPLEAVPPEEMAALPLFS